jgi:chorismate dehydratase
LSIRSRELFFFAQNVPLKPTIRVGAVSYLNTQPFIWGLKNSPIWNQISLSRDFPAAIASQLAHQQIDIGLLPVAALAQMVDAQVISEFCIGSEGPVASVAIFSEVPLEQVTTIWLDYQSKTSVALAQILMQEYWHLQPEWKPGNTDFIEHIGGTEAAVVIGDRALELIPKYPYIYDLGSAWTAHTGLPFVFAAWVANKQLPDEFISAFNEALRLGVGHIDALIPQLTGVGYDLATYFHTNIRYHLTTASKAGMDLFLQKLATHTIQ